MFFFLVLFVVRFPGYNINFICTPPPPVPDLFYERSFAHVQFVPFSLMLVCPSLNRFSHVHYILYVLCLVSYISLHVIRSAVYAKTGT